MLEKSFENNCFLASSVHEQNPQHFIKTLRLGPTTRNSDSKVQKRTYSSDV